MKQRNRKKIGARAMKKFLHAAYPRIKGEFRYYKGFGLVHIFVCVGRKDEGPFSYTPDR